MNITIEQLRMGFGQKTVVFDKITKKYFLVSSVSNFYANETYIFECDKDGNVEDFCEVWGVRPSDHDKVMSMLMNGELTSLDFYLK